MATVVTIKGIAYTVEKLDTGNIRVSHPGGQIHPMRGPETDGLHVFEVHPCQTKWYAFWNERLPRKTRRPPAQDVTAKSRGGARKGGRRRRRKRGVRRIH